MTQEEKDRIDYEINAKLDRQNKEFGEWGCALFIALIIVMLMAGCLNACTN